MKRLSSPASTPRVELLRRKYNLTAAPPNVRLEFDFGEERTVVSRIAIGDEVTMDADAGGQRTRDRIVAVIRNGGPLTATQITQTLADIKPDTVGRVLRRCLDRQVLVKLPSTQGEARIALKDEASA